MLAIGTHARGFKMDVVALVALAVLVQCTETSDASTECDAHELVEANLVVADKGGFGFDRFCRDRMIGNVSLGRWQDKFEVKSIVARLAPGLRQPELLFTALDASEITEAALHALPLRYVMKANHGSQMTVVVDAGVARCVQTTVAKRHKLCPRLDARVERRDEHMHFLKKICARWLDIDFGDMTGQPSYSTIEPRCMFEELISDENGHVPHDIKIYVVHGIPLLVYVTYTVLPLCLTHTPPDSYSLVCE